MHVRISGIASGHLLTALQDCCGLKQQLKSAGSGRYISFRTEIWVLVVWTAKQCLCCDRKSRGAYAQSFALWQQATIEFTCHDHSPRTLVVTFNGSQVNIGRACTPRSLYYCLFAPHICMVLFFTHIPFVVNHTINVLRPKNPAGLNDLAQYPCPRETQRKTSCAKRFNKFNVYLMLSV